MRGTARVIFIGLLMGAAEIVPGVSGGTIAFVSGIYERLVNCIRRFNPMMLVDLKQHGLKFVWITADATFLFTLFASMGLAILLLANAIGYLLNNEPIAVWSFFFGLVVASSLVVGREVNLRHVDTYLALGVGITVGFVVTHITPVELEPTPLLLFLGGTIAVCAWILPGISGSFILLILGLYSSVVEAIRTFDLMSILSLGAGCAVGLMCFTQVLSLLLSRYHNTTLSVLIGFMLGSLAKLWPWKHTVSYQLKPDGSQIPLIEEVVLPETFEGITGQDPQLLLAVVAGIGGCLLVTSLYWMTRLQGETLKADSSQS